MIRPLVLQIFAAGLGWFMLGEGDMRFACAEEARQPSSAPANSTAATRPGGDFDLQGFISGEIKAGKKQIIVPPGRYRVTPSRSQHLLFSNLSDLDILADGVEMICTQTTRAVTFDRCRNVRLRGLTIDYDPLPFTQGKIVAMAGDKSWVEFEISEGYPEDRLEIRIEIFDPATALLKRETYHNWESLTRIGPHRYRATKASRYRYSAQKDTEEIGDILVTNNVFAPGGGIPHAISSTFCAGLVLENITLYASNCFGFIETDCDGTTYLRCRVDRRSAEADLGRRGSPRMRSLNADAYHSKFATKGPSLLECTARFQGDDGVNINGDYHMITSCKGRELRVLAKHRMNIQNGDVVEFLSYDGTRPADANVLTVIPCGEITDDEKAFLLKQRMHEPFRQAQGSALHKAYTITLDRELDLPMGSILASTRKIGKGFRVENCDFSFNRSRGILIKASDGTVKNNRLVGNWGPAILVSPEFWWLEAGASCNVNIENNIIRDCRTTAIDIATQGGNGKIAQAGVHRNLAVNGNVITDSPWPCIVITSTEGLAITDNTTRTTRGEPVIRSRPEWKTQQPQDIVTINCRNERQENNRRVSGEAKK